jgi:hypothetical protein
LRYAAYWIAHGSPPTISIGKMIAEFSWNKQETSHPKSSEQRTPTSRADSST